MAHDEQTTDDEPVSEKTLTEYAPFLRVLSLSNFRAVREGSFLFQQGLNVIVGENNSAKSAVIDAVRVLFSLGTFEKKDDYIRVRPSDVHISNSADTLPTNVTITLTAEFAAGGPSYDSQFYELYCPENSDNYTSVFQLRYAVTFTYKQAKGQYVFHSATTRGGSNFDNPVPGETLDSLRAIYLAPLRDLIADRNRVGSEIERLIVSHTSDDKINSLRDLPIRVREYTLNLIEEATSNKHHAAASKSFASYAKPYKIQADSLSFNPWGISEGLLGAMVPVFQHLLHGAGQSQLPLSSNGLGLNQLIYASIVLSRYGEPGLETEPIRYFAIEEPEAHLHPQLQDSFFAALNEMRENQVFVTSHSPSITAKADLERVIIMRMSETGEAKSLSLSQQLSARPVAKRYLHKFLDVTRSQLLFARGALFVEGVTEGMLMQQISEMCGYSLRDNAIEIVVLDAADGFEHFRPLFSSTSPLNRAVLIGDQDTAIDNLESSDNLRASTLGRFDADIIVDELTPTAIAKGYGTFEFGLLLAATVNGGNLLMQDLLRRALSAAGASTPASANLDAFVKDFLDFKDPALSYRKMREKKKGTYVKADEWHGTWQTNSYWKKSKSEFAFWISEELAKLPADERNNHFIVPKYITDGLEFLIAGEEQPKP